MRYSVLHCVAVCYIVLQCIALCCSVVHCVAVCYIVLQCVTLCCSVLHRVAVCYIVLQCVASYQRYSIGEETMTDWISMCFRTSPTFLENMTNIRLFCWNLVIKRPNLGLVSRNRLRLQGIDKETMRNWTSIHFQISPTLQKNMKNVRLFCRNLVTKWPNLGLVSRHKVHEVATISRLLNIIGLFCKRAL